jgi:hypothetical protein
MKRRELLVVGSVLVVTIAVSITIKSSQPERVVRKLLAAPEIKIEAARKLAGGREPVYGAIVTYEQARASNFCRSLGLFEVTEDDRRKDTLRETQRAFRSTFSEPTNQLPIVHIGTLTNAPAFHTTALIGRDRIYFVFSRY